MNNIMLIRKMLLRCPAAVLAAAVLTAFCWTKIYLQPAEEKLADLRQRRAAVLRELRRLDEFAAAYGSSGSLLAERQEELDRLRRILPPMPDTDAASDRIMETASGYGMKITALRVQAQRPAGEDERLPHAFLHLEMKGSYEGLLKTMRRLREEYIFLRSGSVEGSGGAVLMKAEAAVFGSGAQEKMP